METKNRVQLLGHLGKDPELKQMENGKRVARIRMATNERHKNSKGEWTTSTQWHTVAIWGAAADEADRMLGKGSEIFVEGRLEHRDYNNSDGIRKWISEVVTNSFLLIDKKGLEDEPGQEDS